MEPAEDSLGATIQPPELVRVPRGRSLRILLGLRGALSPDVRREAAALVALAGPVVSWTPSCGRGATSGGPRVTASLLLAVPGAADDLSHQHRQFHLLRTPGQSRVGRRDTRCFRRC